MDHKTSFCTGEYRTRFSCDFRSTGASTMNKLHFPYLGAPLVLENLPHTTAVNWHVPEDGNVHSTHCQSLILTITSDKGLGLQHPRSSPPCTEMYTLHHKCPVCHLLKSNILPLKRDVYQSECCYKNNITIEEGKFFQNEFFPEQAYHTCYTVKKKELYSTGTN